jgi:hypothetical protein
MKQLADMEDEEVSSEVPFDLIPYPYNRVPETFGRDEPQYPELRKLLMRTLDILTRGAGVLSPYAPKGKLVYYDVASIDVDPDSAILHVSDWQGANEIMNFLTNAHLIRWDEDMEAYELAKKTIQEGVDEEEGPSEIPPDLQPYPFNKVSPNLDPEFRLQLFHVLDILREPNSELIVYWREGRDWAVAYLVLKTYTRSGLCTSKEEINKQPARLFQYLNDEINVLQWNRGNSSRLQGYVYQLKKNNITEVINEEDKSKSDLRKVRVLKPFPLNLLPSKLPALFRDVVELLRDPAWMIEPDQTRRSGKLVNVINLINMQTGEIQQLPQAKGEEIFNTLRDVGALTIHPEYSKNYILKRIHESVEGTEDSGDVSSFDRPRHTILPEQIAESPTYFDAWKIFDSKYDELMDINRDRESDESEYTPVIPTGYGQFERWWLGLDDQGPNEWPAPFKQITLSDIEKIAKEDSYEIYGLFSNIFYNHSLSELDPRIMEAVCRLMLEGTDKKNAVRQLLGFQKDMKDILDGLSAESMGAELRDMIIKSSDSPEAIRERLVVARILTDPAEQDALIKNAIENAKRPTRRR